MASKAELQAAGLALGIDGVDKMAVASLRGAIQDEVDLAAQRLAGGELPQGVADAATRALQVGEGVGVTPTPPGPTPGELDAAADAARAQREPEPEVRPEEFTQGTAKPVWESPLPNDVVDTLRAPLDPNRIRKRKGRGGSEFEYLAGHDVKRRANEIFGFGNWGYDVVALEEIGQVEIAKEGGGTGWHVGYRATVRVNVRGCLPTADTGYGDGVEYGPAALVTARELATKEAVTDAIKRAFTAWGDQFGLILYAKGDEKARIERERNASTARSAQPRSNVPRTFTEVLHRLAGIFGGDNEEARETAKAWLQEAVWVVYHKESIGQLTGVEKQECAQLAASVVLDLEERYTDLAFGIEVRDKVKRSFAAKFRGVALEGPPWRLDPGEQDRPIFADREQGAG